METIQNYVVNENYLRWHCSCRSCINNITSKLTVKDVTTTLAVNDVLVGVQHQLAQYTIASIDDRMTFSNDAYTNKDFEEQDSNYLDLSETNPFGEP